MRRCASALGLVFCLCGVMPAQTFLLGAREYALGSSSVMWQSSPAALFSNPAELGHMHQSEFLLSTNRLKSLGSVSGATFIPSFGTLAAGIGQDTGSSSYSIGYGGLVGDHHALGAALTMVMESIGHIAFSVGGVLHFPDTSGAASGLHLAAGLVNFSADDEVVPSRVDLGAAYWIFRDHMRAQVAWQYQRSIGKAAAGIELFPWQGVAFQVGSSGFKSMTVGVCVEAEYFETALGIGKNTVAMSFRFRLSEAAVDARSRHFSAGELAYSERRYAEAYRGAREALVYDDSFTPAHRLADSAWAKLMETSKDVLARGDQLEEEKKFDEAIELYQQLTIIDPDDEEGPRRIARAEERRSAYVTELVAAGDSLEKRQDREGAWRAFEQALALSPENLEIQRRLAALQSSAGARVRQMLDAARNSLQRNRLDDAEKEYGRVLVLEPRNREARQGLEAVRSKRLDLVFERGKAAYAASDYMGALKIFVEVLESNPRHRDAQDYLERTRTVLLPQVDQYFRSGLQFYTNEEYSAALEEWNTVLLIAPTHRDTLEYRKRAEEKLHALERLTHPQ